MRKTLGKKWGPYEPETVLVDNPQEAVDGAVRIGAAKMVQLHDLGYFEAAPPARAIPGEVRTSDHSSFAAPIAAPDIQQEPRAVRRGMEATGEARGEPSGGGVVLGSGASAPGESSDPSPGLGAAADETRAARPSGSAPQDEVLRPGRQPGRPAGRHPEPDKDA